MAQAGRPALHASQGEGARSCCRSRSMLQPGVCSLADGRSRQGSCWEGRCNCCDVGAWPCSLSSTAACQLPECINQWYCDTSGDVHCRRWQGNVNTLLLTRHGAGCDMMHLVRHHPSGWQNKICHAACSVCNGLAVWRAESRGPASRQIATRTAARSAWNISAPLYAYIPMLQSANSKHDITCS